MNTFVCRINYASKVAVYTKSGLYYVSLDYPFASGLREFDILQLSIVLSLVEFTKIHRNLFLKIG